MTIEALDLRPVDYELKTMTTDPLDDDELELEPIDPEIFKAQQKRTKRKSREAEDAIDINAEYDDEDLGDPIDLEQLKKFRFTTRHLLILTAVLAVVMTLMIRLRPCMGMFVSGVVALAASWWFVLREESRRLARVVAEREEFTKRQAMRRAIEDGVPVAENYPKEFEAAYTDGETESEPTRLRFSFSIKEMLGVIALAAVALGLVQWLGGPQNAALLLGLVAVGGLLLQAFSIKLPPIVVFGWWVLLVFYILVSLWTGFAPPVAAV